QAPRASRSHAANEAGIGFVTRHTFGVANDDFVKWREIFAFDERFVDRHLREGKTSRRRIPKLASERGLLRSAFPSGYAPVFALLPKRPGQRADQGFRRSQLFVRTARAVEAFVEEGLQFLARTGGQPVAGERPQVKRERFEPRLIARHDFRPIFIGLVAAAEL